MHTGESKHEAAIQEMKEADEPIFKDCIWDGDYF
jgi:hypothetical protein